MVLKNKVHLRARSFFDQAPMYFSNYLLIPDEAKETIYYGKKVPIVELVHQRPYKNSAAYLESLVLMTNKNTSLMNGILYHHKQLKTTYTHHVHISYQNSDLSAVGVLLQDAVALSMLANGDNAYELEKKFLRYKKNIAINDKALIRIAPNRELSRIEFRRQFGGWPYDKFISWIYEKVLTQSKEIGKNNVKNFNAYELINCSPTKYSPLTFLYLQSAVNTYVTDLKDPGFSKVSFAFWRIAMKSTVAQPIISSEIRALFDETTTIVYEMMENSEKENHDQIVKLTYNLALALAYKRTPESNLIYSLIEKIFYRWPHLVRLPLKTFLADENNSDNILGKIYDALNKLVESN